MASDERPVERGKGTRTRIALILLILVLLLALCGIAYVILGVVRSPERQPVLSEEPGVVWVFSSFGGDFGALSLPDSVAYDGDNRIYVTEPLIGRIAVIDQQGENGRVFAEKPIVEKPKGIDVGADGTVYVADEGKQAVVVLSPGGEAIREIPLESVPYGIAVSDDRLYIACSETLYVTTLEGDPLGQWGSWGRGLDNLAVAADAAVNSDGTVYVTDLNNYRVVSLNPDLARVWQYGATATTTDEHNARLLSGPYGVTIGGDGNIYFMDGLSSEIGVVDPSGKSVSAPLGGRGGAEDQFYMPKGIDWMSEDLFVIADTFHNRIVGVRLTPQPGAGGSTETTGSD